MNISMADIALGIFLGWFLIRIYIQFSDDWKKFEALLQKYFTAKEIAEKLAQEKK